MVARNCKKASEINSCKSISAFYSAKRKKQCGE
jgi:hypothetical protein